MDAAAILQQYLTETQERVFLTYGTRQRQDRALLTELTALQPHNGLEQLIAAIRRRRDAIDQDQYNQARKRHTIPDGDGQYQLHADILSHCYQGLTRLERDLTTLVS